MILPNGFKYAKIKRPLAVDIENEGGSRYVIQHLTRHKCVFRHRPTKALAHFGHFALCNKFLLSISHTSGHQCRELIS